MKTLADLEAIRKQMLDKVTMRKEDENGVRVVVGMATCGIGMCRLEPIVEVFEPNKEKVTYVKMTPEKAVRVVAEHIVNGNPVTEYTIGAVEG